METQKDRNKVFEIVDQYKKAYKSNNKGNNSGQRGVSTANDDPNSSVFSHISKKSIIRPNKNKESIVSKSFN